MRTIRRLIYGEVISSVALVTLGFLALFFFFDFVEELQAIGRHGSEAYQLRHALTYVTLLVPSRVYELLPITVLIGTIFVMARLAQSSEFTILRTSGLGPWRALRALLALGAGFVVLTFAIGDYLAPASDHAAQLLKAKFQGKITVGQTGAWLRDKDKQSYAHYAVNVGALNLADGSMNAVRLFEFDNHDLLVSMTKADLAHFGNDAWYLENAERTELSRRDALMARFERTRVANFRWPTDLTAEMVSAAILKPERMSTLDLFHNIRHLDANGQTAQRYEIEFWKKVFYPLSCLVMVVLALPFAYFHFRSGPITGYVFGGVMAGISFFLLTDVFGYIGNLQSWQPWLTAALPGMIYSMLSLGAFSWLVLRR